MAREAEAKAKREAEEAELKAAAEAAAREEAVARRNAFSATQSTTARRYCSFSTDSHNALPHNASVKKQSSNLVSLPT